VSDVGVIEYCKTGHVAPVGPAHVALIVFESANAAACVVPQEWVSTAVAESVTNAVSVAASITSVSPSTAALDAGATPRTPKPSATTSESAKRLKLVFVDIYFLSIVAIETFPITAGKETFAS
jgi:hypothetical protein